MTKVLTEEAMRQAESHAAVAETILEASPLIVPSLRATLHTDTAIMLRALVSEREALAGRVAELEAALDRLLSLDVFSDQDVSLSTDELDAVEAATAALTTGGKHG